MSNSNTWKSGQQDASQNKGPANKPDWSHQERNTYNAGYNAQKQGSGSGGGKK